MPPKAKFTKEEIIEAALNIVRTDGYEALTSRALGTYLGSSARPIFTVFKNMEEVQQAMIEAAKQNCGKRYNQKRQHLLPISGGFICKKNRRMIDQRPCNGRPLLFPS